MKWIFKWVVMLISKVKFFEFFQHFSKSKEGQKKNKKNILVNIEEEWVHANATLTKVKQMRSNWVSNLTTTFFIGLRALHQISKYHFFEI